MKYLKLFLVFFKIGLISFGGGYGMIIVMKEELIKRGLINEKEFTEALLIAQSAPGALAVNMSIAVAKKIANTIGAVIAFFGVIAPSFIIILILSKIFYLIKGNEMVSKFMDGTKPSVIALISASFYSLFKSYDKEVLGLIIMIVTVFLTVVLKLHPILIIIGAGGFFPILRLLEKFKEK